MRIVSFAALAVAMNFGLEGCGSSDDDSSPSRAGHSGASSAGNGASGGTTGGATGGATGAGASGKGGGAGSPSGGKGGANAAGGSGQGGVAGGEPPGAGMTGDAGDGGTTNGGNGGSAPLPPELQIERETAPSGSYVRIWGSGAHDIYAVGNSGAPVHSAGDGTWTAEPAGTSALLTGVWGSGAGDVYVSVDANFMLHSAGDGQWDHEDVELGYTFNGVWGTSTTNVYALVGNGVMHSEGDGNWEIAGAAMAGPPAAALWGSSATDLYLATGFANTPTIYHSTSGVTWTPESQSPHVSLEGLSGTGPNRIYAAGVESVFASDGDGAWTAELTVANDTFKAVWAAAPDAVYACSQNGLIYRSNGAGAWSEPYDLEPDINLFACYAIWGTDPSNVYFGTSNGIYHGTP